MMPINVLGFELEAGRQILESNGYNVTAAPCDDKPMTGADTNIIVRQKAPDKNTVEILYGAFKTRVGADIVSARIEGKQKVAPAAYE